MSKYVPPHMRGAAAGGGGGGDGARPPPEPPRGGRWDGGGSSGGGGGGGGFQQRGGGSGRDFGGGGSGRDSGGGGGGNSRWDTGGGYGSSAPRAGGSSEAPGSVAAWNRIRETAGKGGAAGGGSGRGLEGGGSGRGVEGGGGSGRDFGGGSGRNMEGGGGGGRRFEGRRRDDEAPPGAEAAVSLDQLTPEQLAKMEEERLVAEKERHPDMFSVETTTLTEFYTTNSAVFRRWAEARSAGYSNKFIAHFFDKKKGSRDSQQHRAGAHEGAEIRPIFTQFFKYAIDIDNGLAYTERMIDVAEATGKKCWFLDFGFAPGGMADLLLEAHPGIHGVGVSLEPSKGGNVYLEVLDRHERFTPFLGDIIDMARANLDLVTACNLPADFDGFDLVIPGITIHQEWEGDNMNELKDLLHFAQLFFAVKYLKPGGMVMMRMHMSVRLVDCHMLALMLSMFQLERFSGLAVGLERQKAAVMLRERAEAEASARAAQGPAGQEEEDASHPAQAAQGRSKLDQMVRKRELAEQRHKQRAIPKHYAWLHLDRTAVATKPFSTFSMRKTYWVMYHGFSCTDEHRASVLAKLAECMQENIFAYGFNADKNCFNHPVLMDEPIDQLMAKYGQKMIGILEDVWQKQVEALEGFMVGQTDKFCRDGTSCSRRSCNMAHTSKDMIPAVMDALDAVDIRARPRITALINEGLLS
jgi:hypothetical protein